MRNIIDKALILSTCIISTLQAQQVPSPNEKPSCPIKEDVTTISGIMQASYEVVSGEAGAPRQWERDLSLHDPNALYSFPNIVDGRIRYITMSLEDFHKKRMTW